MAHFAKLDENNLVVEVVVTNNDDPNEGLDWLEQNFPATWIKTSYNTFGGQHLQNRTPLRKNYAGIGFIYDPNRDAFIPPKPFDSWLLNEETCLWEAPIPYPTDGNDYAWDETLQNWVAIN